jgi:predicted  nucleic acid-binding Zn-ribbon protein
MTHRPDPERIIKECEWAIARIEDYGSTTMMSRSFFADVEKLLKEQEAVVPYIDIDEAKCPSCKIKLTRQELIGDDVLFEDFFDYCPRCGRKVKWE